MIQRGGDRDRSEDLRVYMRATVFSPLPETSHVRRTLATGPDGLAISRFLLIPFNHSPDYAFLAGNCVSVQLGEEFLSSLSALQPVRISRTKGIASFTDILESSYRVEVYELLQGISKYLVLRFDTLWLAPSVHECRFGQISRFQTFSENTNFRGS